MLHSSDYTILYKVYKYLYGNNEAFKNEIDNGCIVTVYIDSVDDCFRFKIELSDCSYNEYCSMSDMPFSKGIRSVQVSKIFELGYFVCKKLIDVTHSDDKLGRDHIRFSNQYDCERLSFVLKDINTIFNESNMVRLGFKDRMSIRSLLSGGIYFGITSDNYLSYLAKDKVSIVERKVKIGMTDACWRSIIRIKAIMYRLGCMSCMVIKSKLNEGVFIDSVTKTVMIVIK